MPRSLRDGWTGIDGDYDLACSVEGYTGIVRKGGVDVLVLNDEPLLTTFIVVDGRQIFVRWIFAPGYHEVEDALRVIPAAPLIPLEEVHLRTMETNLLLFDSAERGDRVAEFLELALPIGTLRFVTSMYRPKADTALLLHEVLVA